MTKRKIVFLTGTRADYGKIKPLLHALEASSHFELYVFVTGMHLLKKFGETYHEILNDGYSNVFVSVNSYFTDSTSYNLGQVIQQFTGYITHLKPDAIVVHGDRIEALAGATVGALNNIHVMHIEGGEVSGTIDESIRHAITKFANTHFVANSEARDLLLQMGECSNSIHIIGSPDIDVMLSDNLPDLASVKQHYQIPFEHYGIMLFHPVTTEYDTMLQQTEQVVKAAVDSGKNFIVIYPNNDYGCDFILQVYTRELSRNPHFRIFPSLRFERFLTLLKHADFIYGNSSAGIREAMIYGIPAIDIGSRQQGRYFPEKSSNIQHCPATAQSLERALAQVDSYRKTDNTWGNGNSTQLFLTALADETLWPKTLQKYFIQRR